ncbi:hypothetical protein Goklo_010771, partial [Gossypium klotzschianum]|nr:hypothetical protein [Gossypium klotzschianum]
MFNSVATALLFVEIKDAAFLKSMSKVMVALWLKWELRVMVVLSLTVQLILLALSHTMIAGLDSSSGFVSSGVALYIYVKFWTLAAPTMLILAIPIFIVGIIKYGERVWALFQASKMGMEFQSSDKDMLTYVAAQCSWKEHARQLQQGEELLTRVALLMAHLGLSKNIQK